MTLTASPTRLPSTVAAARTVDVTKVYGAGDTAVRALDGVTVELPAGRVTTIMAPSGFGKSTLMHCDNSRGVILIAPIGLTLPIVRFPC